MTKIYSFVEGPTEQKFVDSLLKEHFYVGYGIEIYPVRLFTSKGHKGGVPPYQRVKDQIIRMFKEHPDSYVTTMIDYYGLPTDFPGYANRAISDPVRKVEFLEDAISKDLGKPRFIPYFSLHEFEALLYSDPAAFKLWFGDQAVAELNRERKSFQTPELINNSYETAPSKRIEAKCLGYTKTLHGTLISLDIGLGKMRAECPHFNQWLQKLEKLGIAKSP